MMVPPDLVSGVGSFLSLAGIALAVGHFLFTVSWRREVARLAREGGGMSDAELKDERFQARVHRMERASRFQLRYGLWVRSIAFGLALLGAFGVVYGILNA